MSVNKVQLANGETIVDISDSTVTPEALAEGVTAYDASGTKITGKMVQGGGTFVQADWNQTDETAPDFIKNKPESLGGGASSWNELTDKPFGEQFVEIVPETEVTGAEENGGYTTQLDASVFPSDVSVLSIEFDGVEYICNADTTTSPPYSAYGNLGLLDPSFPDTGEPFMLMVYPGAMAMLVLPDGETHKLRVSELAVVQMDEKYLPPRKTFYVNYNDTSDIYLYSDEGKTTKATMDEIKAADAMHGIRVVRDFAMYTTPVAIKTGVSSGSGVHDYAAVTVFAGVVDGNATWKTYYTDKYTAT